MDGKHTLAKGYTIPLNMDGKYTLAKGYTIYQNMYSKYTLAKRFYDPPESDFCVSGDSTLQGKRRQKEEQETQMHSCFR